MAEHGRAIKEYSLGDLEAVFAPQKSLSRQPVVCQKAMQTRKVGEIALVGELRGLRASAPLQCVHLWSYVDGLIRHKLELRVHTNALRSLNEALILRYETQDRLRIVATLLAIGDTYRGADQLDEAFEHYVRAWREGEDLHDRDEALARIEALGIEATRAFLDGEASALAEESIDIA